MASSRKSAGAAEKPKERRTGSKPAAPEDAPEKLPAGLYVVATPIGNLGDITLRALDVLKAADAIACEDTRVTGKLLAGHDIRGKLVAYHDHNAAKARPQIIKRLKNGEAVALVSDAGTPLISDPGFRLVRACHEEEVDVTVVPGASSVTAALALAGLPTDRFLFGGFLPPKSAARKKALAELARLKATLIFFETGSRLAESMADMAGQLGDREAVVARELTKLHEEVRRGGLKDLAAAYKESDPPKGELVVLIGPAADAAPESADLDSELRRALATLSLRDAVAEVATITGLPRRQVYSRALALAPSAGKLKGIE